MDAESILYDELERMGTGGEIKEPEAIYDLLKLFYELSSDYQLILLEQLEKIARSLLHNPNLMVTNNRRKEEVLNILITLALNNNEYIKTKILSFIELLVSSVGAKKSNTQHVFQLRQFRLHKSLKKIDIRQPLKPGFESVISTDSLLAPILTPNTILILKIQNHLNNNELDCGKFNEKVRETTYVDVNSETFKQKCRECSYYCFSIGLAHGENIDLVAKGYQLFKQWVNGINALVKYKKYIPKLYSRIESYTSV